MFTYKETKDALFRQMAAKQLPGFVCIAVDLEDNISGSADGFLGDFDTDEMPRVSLDLRKLLIDEEEDGKRKRAKKIKEFEAYLYKGKFDKQVLKGLDLKKKIRAKFAKNYFVSDFHTVPVDKIIDTGKDSEFRGMTGLMITMRKGPKSSK